jgi:hypothetical protein
VQRSIYDEKVKALKNYLIGSLTLQSVEVRSFVVVVVVVVVVVIVAAAVVCC